jgi:hypothetical protein
MASVLQVFFKIPAIADRYYGRAKEIFLNERGPPAENFHVQMYAFLFILWLFVHFINFYFGFRIKFIDLYFCIYPVLMPRAKMGHGLLSGEYSVVTEQEREEKKLCAVCPLILFYFILFYFNFFFLIFIYFLFFESFSYFREYSA